MGGKTIPPLHPAPASGRALCLLVSVKPAVNYRHMSAEAYAVPCTACGKDALRTDWETIDAGSVNFHWREVCSHWGHVSESLFA